MGSLFNVETNQGGVKLQFHGQGVDIKNGWDLSVQQDRDLLYHDFMKSKSDVLILTVPCDQFSTMQIMSMGRIPLKVGRLRMDNAMELLKFAVKLADAQLKAGRHVVIEHLIGSQMWGKRCMRQLFARYKCYESRFDQCEF